jgi:hypothetical protein
MYKFCIFGFSLAMSVATPLLAELPRVFELAGKRTMIGSWVVVEQETGTTAIIAQGSTSTSNYADTLELAGGTATLQLTCHEGVLRVLALMPGASDLAAGATENWQGLFSLEIAGEQSGIVKKEMSANDAQGESFIVPLVEATSQNEVVSKIRTSENVTITAANMALHRVRARFNLAGNEEAFEALGSRLIDRQSQNMTVAARATADRKVLAHLS